MKQLPAWPGSPVLLGCEEGQPATVSFGAQDAASRGRRWQARGSLRGGEQGFWGLPWTRETCCASSFDSIPFCPL